MKKKKYEIPTINVVRINVENLMGVGLSGGGSVEDPEEEAPLEGAKEFKSEWAELFESEKEKTS